MKFYEFMKLIKYQSIVQQLISEGNILKRFLKASPIGDIANVR